LFSIDVLCNGFKPLDFTEILLPSSITFNDGVIHFGKACSVMMRLISSDKKTKSAKAMPVSRCHLACGMRGLHHPSPGISVIKFLSSSLMLPLNNLIGCFFKVYCDIPTLIVRHQKAFCTFSQILDHPHKLLKVNKRASLGQH